MSYSRSSHLIARRGYGSADHLPKVAYNHMRRMVPARAGAGVAGLGALGSLLDDLKGAAGKVINFYGQAQKDAGAAALAQTQATATAAAQAAAAQQQAAMYAQQAGGGIGGISSTTLMLGAAGLGLFLMLRR